MFRSVWPPEPNYLIKRSNILSDMVSIERKTIPTKGFFSEKKERKCITAKGKAATIHNREK